jgi:exosortase
MTKPQGNKTFVALAVFLVAIWILLYRNLAMHWAINRQYSYGWIVPAVSAYMFALRWRSRPPAGPPVSGAYWIAGFAALLFFPTWFLLQPNPDWRSLDWLFAAETAAITISMAALVGGRPWVRHFAFPCFFVFTAIPWPRPLEIPIVASLAQLIAGISVELLNFTGVTALQLGNVIEVPTGLLGVEEACSGIQSLQATLMAALFFGDFFRLGIGRRITLALCGLVIAILTNIARTYCLAWDAALFGVSAMEKIHDQIGDVTLTLCFVLVWVGASLSRPKIQEPEPHVIEDSITHAPASGFLWALAVWMLAVVVASEVWFHNPEAIQSNWTLRPPANSSPIEISPRTAELLMADKSVTGKWIDTMGDQWQFFFFQWNAGPVRSRLLARLHRPEICLPATGARLTKRRAPVPIFIEGVRHELNAYTFTREGASTFVYWGAWENRSAHANERGVWSTSLPIAGLQSVWWRERNLEQQVIELAVSGCNDATEADSALTRVIPMLIVRQD